MRNLILLVGNIGSGKSTKVKEFQRKGYIVIARDSLRYCIGAGTYIFNYDYEDIIWNVEAYMFEKFVDKGTDIIVDEVGLTKEMRARYITYAKNKGYKIIAIVFPKLSMREAVDRRLQNPHGQPKREMWEQVWSNFDSIYEEPSKREGIDNIIKLEREDIGL